jgi:hypothetical protein
MEYFVARRFATNSHGRMHAIDAARVPPPNERGTAD